MTNPILCNKCGHDIDAHRALHMCSGCSDEIFTRGEDELCYMHPSDIARAYAKALFHEGWDACELQWAAVRHE